MGIIAAQVLDTHLTRVSSFQVRENGLVRCREYSARLSPQVGIPRNRVQKTGVQGQVAQCSEAQYSGSLDCELSEAQYVSHSVVVHKDSSALCPTTLI